jgi:hypothetical protein
MPRFLAFAPRADSTPDDSAASGLLAFHAEHDEPAPRDVAASAPQQRLISARLRRAVVVDARTIAVLAATASVAIILVILIAYVRTQRNPAHSAQGSLADTGVATFNSSPSGAEITIDGVFRGVTPINLTLPAGPHQLAVRSGTATRSIPVMVEAGRSLAQYVELAEPSVAGSLGSLAGTTPVTAAPARIGEQSVAVSGGANAAGWMTVNVPVEVQIFEGGQLIGTSQVSRLMLPAGRHDLEVASTSLEFRKSLSVRILPGKTTTTTVALPSGSVSINVLPWADVWIDGRPVGSTPIANLVVPIGPHEIVWRHPQLGERHRTIAVTAQTPTRLGLNFDAPAPAPLP